MSFGGQAPPGPTGGAYSPPPDPLDVSALDRRWRRRLTPSAFGDRAFRFFFFPHSNTGYSIAYQFTAEFCDTGIRQHLTRRVVSQQMSDHTSGKVAHIQLSWMKQFSAVMAQHERQQWQVSDSSYHWLTADINKPSRHMQSKLKPGLARYISPIYIYIIDIYRIYIRYFRSKISDIFDIFNFHRVFKIFFNVTHCDCVLIFSLRVLLAYDLCPQHFLTVGQLLSDCNSPQQCSVNDRSTSPNMQCTHTYTIIR